MPVRSRVFCPCPRMLPSTSRPPFPSRPPAPRSGAAVSCCQADRFPNRFNSMLQVASIGADGMPYGDIKQIALAWKKNQIRRVFANIDSSRLRQGRQGFPRRAALSRTMWRCLDELGGQGGRGERGDSRSLARPRQHRGRLKRGKHVYCQKAAGPHRVGVAAR